MAETHRVVDGLVWEYLGQRVSDTTPTLPAVIEARSAPPGTDTVLGSIQVNGAGEVWVAREYVSGTKVGSHPAARDVEVEGPYSWEPMTWTSQGCGATTVRMYDGETRSRLATLSTAHDLHRSVVKIRTDLGECSGVLVGPRDVLTAAHCVAAPSGSPLGVPIISDARSVCSRGNYYTGADCVWNPPGGFTVTVNGAWAAGSTEIGDDFALIEWAEGPEDEEALTGGTSGVPLSTDTHSTINATRAGVYGHPTYTSSAPNVCDWQQTSPAAEASVVPPNVAIAPHHLLLDVWRTDHNHTTTRIRTRFDGAQGQSGGPYYQCVGSPTSCGGPTERVIGIQSGYNLVPTETRRIQGPNAATMTGFVDFFLAGD